ncbi:NADH dehydrogenase subunit 5 (mitochondrion) [Mizuhopecten yessoensis]|uniref:NADH-ubiquinone oxidoreductase chain 5 n=1 Tax=Mizuhopecten yessoensis TaxID=6573 RepID=A3KCM0_MIZYE|nr:NADH dehydrogenase subunit 5 [Mizuhopecten yessoensis]ACL36038.1 NADH dehydrogenase subunit 5 [Mizuhopecten yessoensis]BAF47964.1 NADH dehydrogenase subunit 5 [Mizuhopecten yessoensis]
MLKPSMKVSYYARWFAWEACFLSLLGALLLGEDMYVVGWELLRYSSCGYSIEVLVDRVGLIFSGVVFLVSGCVFKFSDFYMRGEPYSSRFHCLLMCFVFSMVLFIFIPNLFGLMLGWDGLGIFSFLLIIFYPASSSLSAGFFTALTNRLGDSFIILVMLFSGLSLGETSCLGEGLGFLGFFLALGSMTKSAQYPFSSWLPQAMAAPTPVSSLVHSSTLVTAGVFLIIRYCEGLSGGVLSVLQWSSLITLMISGVAACLEYDLKKVVALSTLSQVSLMMFSVSVGFPALAFFHLVAHAVTKALLFICVGLIIKGYGQDLRRLSSCFKEAPEVKWYFISSCAGLCGFPFFSGFYSKEMILETLFMSELSVVGTFLFLVGVFSTGYYSARLIFFCFFSSLGKGRESGSMGFRSSGCDLPEVHSCCFPLFLFSVFMGSWGSWYIFTSPCLYSFGLVKFMAISIPGLGVWWFWVREIAQSYRGHYFWQEVDFGGESWRESEVNKSGVWRRSFFRELGFLDGLSSQPFVYWGFMLSEEVNSWMEQGWLEYCGPMGLSSWFKNFLDCNMLMSSHWFNFYVVLYVACIVFWVIIS